MKTKQFNIKQTVLTVAVLVITLVSGCKKDDKDLKFFKISASQNIYVILVIIFDEYWDAVNYRIGYSA